MDASGARSPEGSRNKDRGAFPPIRGAHTEGDDAVPRSVPVVSALEGLPLRADDGPAGAGDRREPFPPRLSTGWSCRLRQDRRGAARHHASSVRCRELDLGVLRAPPRLDRSSVTLPTMRIEKLPPSVVRASLQRLLKPRAAICG